MPVYTLQAPSDVLAAGYVNMRFSIGISLFADMFLQEPHRVLGTIRIICIVLLKLNICNEKNFKFSSVIGYAEFARWPDYGSNYRRK